MSDGRKSMIQSEFRRDEPLVPAEIIRAWNNSEYRIGDRPSTDYQYIGAALAIRGYYRYATLRYTEGTRKPLHAGYCVIDFDGPDLFIAGVRVYTGPEQPAPHQEQLQWVHPIYWRSRYSKFVSEGTFPKVHFGYCAFKFAASRDVTYNPSAWHEGPLPPDAENQFLELEKFWSPIRNQLKTACDKTQLADNRVDLIHSLRKGDWDGAIMEYIQNRDRFTADLRLLQHHAATDELVGTITVDIERTVVDRPQLQVVAAVYQPLDLPATPEMIQGGAHHDLRTVLSGRRGADDPGSPRVPPAHDGSHKRRRRSNNEIPHS